MDAYYYNANFTDILKNKMAPKSHLFDVSSSKAMTQTLPASFPPPPLSTPRRVYLTLHFIKRLRCEPDNGSH